MKNPRNLNPISERFQFVRFICEECGNEACTLALKTVKYVQCYDCGTPHRVHPTEVRDNPNQK